MAENYLKDFVIDGADVYLSTCAGATTLTNRQFPVVILEESSRIGTNAALRPISLLDTENNHFRDPTLFDAILGAHHELD
ncbi:unnamed protein product, partial [Amoebophrya sp. A120]|eukprot:GSA120T00002888001.1